MKKPSILCAKALALYLLSSVAASAAITVSFSFSPTLAAGSDANGFVGSTWTFDFEVTDTEYSPIFTSYAKAPVSTATLTVSGAGNAAANGTFTITEPQGFALYPDIAGEAFLGLDGDYNGANFSFAGLSVGSFSAQGPESLTVAPGDTIEASHFDGLIVSKTTSFGVGFDGYTFSNAPVTVPEPSSWAAIGGVLALAAVAIRRRRTTKA